MENRKEIKPGMKLALCIPSTGSWKANFGMAITQMCVYIGSVPFEDYGERTAIVLDKRTSLLSRSRQECLEDALLQNCTHALFVDTDQSFPHDTVHQLLRWKKPVVAANIALKSIPSYPTARVRGATPFGVPVDSHWPKRGIEQVWRVGAGLVLIEMAVVKDLPKPWFEVRYDAQTQQYIGEDWHFFGLLEKAGIPLYIDHDLSRQVGHIGDFTYTHANIPMIEDAQAA